MILLDTNVLSELMRSRPNPAVRAWLDAQTATSVWTTSVTVFEVRAGIAGLPLSQRRRDLEAKFDILVRRVIEERIQPFDVPAALRAAEVAAARRRSGHPVEVRDIQIAGIALARRATLATRSTRQFEGLGVPLVDPWVVGAG